MTPQLRIEQWNSFVAELSSELAALEAHGALSEVKIEELFNTELYITASTGVLSIWIDEESGHGSWNAITTDQTVEQWVFSSDDAVELNGEIMNIKTAAERFAAKLLPDQNHTNDE